MNRAQSLIAGIGGLLAISLCAGADAAETGPSFPCAKATVALEKLICADDALARADRLVAERYDRLRSSLSAPSFATVRANQIDWVKWVRATCAPGHRILGKSEDEDDRLRSDQDAATCLSDAYRDRSGLLTIPVRKIGSLTLEGRLQGRTGLNPILIETALYPWLGGEPTATAAAFNRHVAQVMALADAGKGIFGPGPRQIKVESDLPGTNTWWSSFELHRADSRLISFEVFTYHVATAGHGWHSEAVVNWDLQRNRPLGETDLFVHRPGWQQALTELVIAEAGNDGEITVRADSISPATVANPQAWLFGADQAYWVLGQSELSPAWEPVNIAIPYSRLAPFLKPGGAVLIPKAPPGKI